MKYKDLSYAFIAVIIAGIVAMGFVMPEFFRSHRLAKLIIISLLSIFVVMKSASNIIYALSSYGKKTGLSEYLIGFLVLSIGTSAPELTTAFVAAMTNQSILTLGNILGGNIIDITIILGVTAIIGRHISVHGKILTKTIIGVIGVTLLPILLGIDGNLSRMDGIILLLSFTGYIYLLYIKEGTVGKVKNNIELKNVWKDMFIFLGSLAALLLSARWLVTSSISMAKILDIPIFILGLFVIAVGTSMPELTIAIKSVLYKGSMQDIAFGDILGAVVANSSLVLGIASIISPISFEIKSFILPAMFMFMALFIGVLFIKKKEITWEEGIGLLLIYLTFVVAELLIRL